MSNPKSVYLAAMEIVQSDAFPYFLYGGLAASLHGEPRYTKDVDFVLFVPEREVTQFLRVASQNGFSVDEDLAIQQIQISGWARLPLGDPKSPWVLDITLGDSPFDQSAFQRRIKVTLMEREVWICSAEDLIIYKLVSGRDQDLVDAKKVYLRQKNLEAPYLIKWADWWKDQGVKEIRDRLDKLIKT